MPQWLQFVTHFNPVRHFIEVLRGVLLKGATMRDVAPQLVALAGLGVVVFSLAVRAMRRQLQ
jgi:ABC-2 type transport system permease protein